MREMMMKSLVMLSLLALLLLVLPDGSLAFQQTAFRRSSSSSSSSRIAPSSQQLQATTEQESTTTKQRRSSYIKEDALQLLQQEEGAGIEGADFFGGNKQKEELFDAKAEENAELELEIDESSYSKFKDSQAFTDSLASNVAQSIQGQINAWLYVEYNNNNKQSSTTGTTTYSYSNNLEWKSIFPKSVGGNTDASPQQAIQEALKFYNRVDIAITSGHTVSNTDTNNQVQLGWEISVAWPNVLGNRVLVFGHSIVTLDSSTNTIVKQEDFIQNESNFLANIASQATPRFWDLFHIGVTPSAELSPIIQQPTTDNNNKKSIFHSYQLMQLPARLSYQSTINDYSNDRLDAKAGAVPNGAFINFIKTVGPFRQRYVTTCPLQISIKTSTSNDDDKKSNTQVIFDMPTSVEFQTSFQLPLAPPENEDEYLPNDEDNIIQGRATNQYKWQPERWVATLPYSGNPQDVQVESIRQKLYTQCIERDGYTPKLDPKTKRPIFFFWMNNVKLCYTAESGLGMAVYESRPGWNADCGAVGIELELLKPSSRSMSAAANAPEMKQIGGSSSNGATTNNNDDNETSSSNGSSINNSYSP